ncbi:MAG: helix-turn-helix domain-containing protein [Clostridia bacterium]|nr:helix-turn-helix domain-containing protein [Clostridia bacterium]MDD4047591.1 helix-turn-helix domain-containing protein [Clostridia bacterium]
MDLGTRLKRLRQEKNLTQSQFGAIFNLAESTISLYEANKRCPDFIILKLFINYFNVTADYLLCLSDKRNFDPPNPASLLNDPSEVYDCDKHNLPDISNKCPYFWIKIKDDFLREEGILAGDFALIKKQPTLEEGKLHAININENIINIGRIFKKNNALVLTYANHNCPPLLFTGKEIESIKVIGKVIKILRFYEI